MARAMIEIVREVPEAHAEAIEALYDRTFGPGHFAKTAERLREGTVSLPKLSRVALDDGAVIAACRIWPLEIGAERRPAIFVGPVAVHPDYQGARLGQTLTQASLDAAKAAGWGAAVIIGAPSYFGPLGFSVAAPGQLQLPGPQDPSRLMVLALGDDETPLEGAVRVPIHPKQYLKTAY